MKLWKLSSVTIALVLSTNVNAALLERLGGLAYYDDVANLTWLADANAAMTSGYDADGRMNWQQSMDWAAGLTVGGVDGWRLPDSDTCLYYDCTGSEMGNLYYNVLGNTSGSGSLRTNDGPFSNIQNYSYYWSATEYNAGARDFSMYDGIQGIIDYKSVEVHAWAVRSGDVSAVPVPTAIWLFSSGLIGLIGVARCKKA